MTEPKVEIYRRLQKHLDKFAVGFPATKSGVELRILQHLFTPKEAQIAQFLEFSFETINVIHSRIKNLEISLSGLENNLNNLVKKGCINFKEENGKKLYANAVLVIGMFEYQVKNLTKDFLKDVYKYTAEAFGRELNRTGITQLRTIPVEQSITYKLGVASHENMREIIENYNGPIAVVECICRKGKELLGKPCKQTSLRETCFPFGWHAEFFIKNGWGRPITKKEVIKIIKKAQDDGLVIQASNTVKPHVICCCCSCCCGSISSFKKLARPIEFFTSNYFAEIDFESCIGCETCIDRCQMTAITIINEEANINLNRCIGCGNCVASCPEEAIHLRNKDVKEVPAETMDDLYVKIMNKKKKKQ
ncbi:MAG: 4Fe-4S binding protein [Promethearchaeota archaeon]